MNENNSMRRQELLNETRRQMGSRHSEYILENKSDYFGVPAIHPRYRASYRSLYDGDETQGRKSTLFARTITALILFFLFVFCDYQKITWNGMDVSVIEQKIISGGSYETLENLLESINIDDNSL